MADRAVYPRRFVPGVMALPADGKLVIAGTSRRQVFRGKTAMQVIPRLLPLLDGSRTAEEICGELSIGTDLFARATSALDNCGLLESASGTEALDTLPSAVVAHYARFRDSRVFSGVGEMADILATARVGVVAEDDLADRITEDLSVSGVRGVQRAPWPLGRDGVTEPSGWQDCDWAIVVEGPENPRATREVCRSLADRAVPVLRLAVTEYHLEVGPCLYPGYGACAECLARSRRDAGWDRPAEPPSPAMRELVSGVACAEAVSLLLGEAGSRLTNRVYRISLPDLTTERFISAPHPACPDCGPGTVEEGARWAAGSAVRNEWLTLLPPESLRNRAPFSREEDARNVRLTAERPRFPSHPSRPLPTAEAVVHGVFGEDRPDRSPALDDEAFLSELLRRVGGRRRSPAGDPMERWAPTGGNLGSVEMYVLRESGLSGLPGTLFRYDDLTHSLIAVRPDAVPAEQLLEGTDLTADKGSATVVVLVAALARCAVKYPHAQRLVHLDAGCAMTQLAATAVGLGWDAAWAERWDERPAQVLRLPDKDQIVTGVALLHRNQSRIRS